MPLRCYCRSSLTPNDRGSAGQAVDATEAFAWIAPEVPALLEELQATSDRLWGSADFMRQRLTPSEKDSGAVVDALGDNDEGDLEPEDLMIAGDFQDRHAAAG